MLAVLFALALTGLALAWFADGGLTDFHGRLIIALAAAAAVAMLVTLLLANMQIGGYTGDVLGAVQQMAEIAVLVVGLGAMRWLA